ncbi:MAG: hypothetical protein J6C37_00070 [Roseburia sp.]|nr:hypothetical protein [Roseburia sp.]
MKQKKSLILGCSGLSLILIVGSILCFPTPSTARVMNHDVLTVQLEPSKETEALVSCNFLAEEGQTILIQNEFKELVIPITVYCEDYETLENITGTVKAVSSDDERMNVSVDADEFVMDKSEYTVKLTINMIEAVEGEVESEPGTESGTETGTGTGTENGTDSESGTESGTETGTESGAGSGTETGDESGAGNGTETGTEPGTGTESTPESGTNTESDSGAESGIESALESENVQSAVESGIETTSESGTGQAAAESGTGDVSEPGTENETTSGNSSELEAENGTETETGTTSEAGTEPEAGNGTETETETETKVKNEQKTAANIGAESESESDSKSLSAEATIELGERTFSASLIIDTEIENETKATGDLQYYPSQYHPEEIVKLVNGQDTDCELGKFPAMTKCVIENHTYLLYDGGSITIPAGKEAEIDLSQTELMEDFSLTTGEGKTYTMKYVELPQISEEDLPLVVGGEGRMLPISYKWGELEPTITIEHLTVGDEEPIWAAAENVIVMKESDVLTLIPNNAKAGTYRAIVSWIENDITLYQIEISFFIQYEREGQGGTGQ